MTLPLDSLTAYFATLTPEQRREEIARRISRLEPRERAELFYNWRLWARDAQLMPPGDHWDTWMMMAGRGFGKTRSGGEAIRELWKKGYNRFALIAPTAADARDVMVEGESGLLNIGPKHERPAYEPSKRRLTWPNGARGTLFSADEPERLRGPQHDAGWCDELAAWRYAQEAWDMYQMGLRLGTRPVTIVTTTPRPIPLVKELYKEWKSGGPVVVTGGSTYDNAVNLAPTFTRRIVKRYEGTRLGLQELHAKLLDDNPNALWTRENLDQHRARKAPTLMRAVVAIDPAVTAKPDSDETGMIVAGIDEDRDAYVLDDHTGIYKPVEWARKAIHLYRLHKADAIIAEANNGGDLVERNIQAEDDTIPVRLVHASKGKYTRAEPVATLYEKGRVHHVGTLAKLEDEMTEWDPKTASEYDSPNRIDALVWGLFDLILESEQVFDGMKGYS